MDEQQLLNFLFQIKHHSSDFGKRVGFVLQFLLEYKTHIIILLYKTRLDGS